MNLEQIRAAIEAKASELDAVSNQQRTVAEGVASVVRAFDALAESSLGADQLAGVLAADGGAYPFSLTRPDNAEATVQLALILLGRKHVEASARAFLTQRAGDHEGISAADRHTAITRLNRELRELAKAEEREVLRIEQGGDFVPRRAEADPAIILEVWKESL